MNHFLNKVKRLERKHLHELTVLCGSMALLLMIAAFISAGVPNKAYAWIIYIYPFTYTPVTTGGYTTISWNAPTADGCGLIGPTLPCYRTRGGRTACGQSFLGATGSVYTGPINGPTNYIISCYNVSGGIGSSNAQGFNSLTVVPTAPPPPPPPPPPPTPTTLTSFTATPSSIPSGTPTTLTWQGTKGTNFSACELAGGQWGGGAWFTALPGSIGTNPLTANTTYSMDCFDTTGGSTGWRSATVTVTAPPPPLGPCTDIPAQPAVPNGCVTPTPPPGICIPAGGSYSAASNTCSCPAGTHLAGSACVANPLCANGLNNSYAPSCTCPAGQYQPLGSATCTALPVCANGLSQSYSPSCTCPAGQVQSGATCVLAGAINSLTASPSRVLKGNTTTISWSTSHMAACSLSGFNVNGTATLSSVLSWSITPVVNSKTIYTLSCTDTAGVSYASSVTVDLIPQTIEQ